jgi:hypothetical protein
VSAPREELVRQQLAEAIIRLVADARIVTEDHAAEVA